MKTKVEPKLKFEVGEKVVITNDDWAMNNNSLIWPNEDDFTITTITKVNDDGSVEVEGGYVYRQSYKTEYGYTEVHNYFRIKRVPQKGDTKFNSKRYVRSGYGSGYCNVYEKASFSDVTYLFKLTKKFEDKVVEYQERFDKAQAEKAEAEKKYEEKEAKRRPHLDAFREVLQPLEEQFFAEKSKAWKELVCAHCKYNYSGMCSKWRDENGGYKNLETSQVTDCSAFEGR